MNTLFHLSDIHFDVEDKGALRWVEAAIAEHHPEGLIVTGDYTMRARPREFSGVGDWLGGLGVPLWCEIGNHDMPYFNPLARITQPFARYKAMRERAIQRAGAYRGTEGLVLVSLQTTQPFQKRWPWVDGNITDEALARCLNEIDALPAGTQALVCAHHPLPEHDSSGKLRTIGGNKAMIELAQRPVAAVLTGHIHDPFDRVDETPKGRLRMIGAGTLSTRLRSTPPGFNCLTWDGGKLTCETLSYPSI